MGRLPQRRGPETEPVLAPADAGAHQSGSSQHLHVFRAPVKRDGEAACDAADVQVASRQGREDGAAGGVGDGRVHPVQPGLRGISSGHIIIQPIGRILSTGRGLSNPSRNQGEAVKMTKHMTGTRKQWLAARRELLEAEKELTRRSDELARRRQELPWVRIDKDYRFATDEGSASLADLFRGRSHTSELQSPCNLVCRLLLEKKKKNKQATLNAKSYIPAAFYGTKNANQTSATDLAAPPLRAHAWRHSPITDKFLILQDLFRL